MGLQYAISIMNINLSCCNVEFEKATPGAAAAAAKQFTFSVFSGAIIVHELLLLTFWLLWTQRCTAVMLLCPLNL
jgi:hypothetical protein